MSDKIKTTKEEREAKKALKLAQEKERVENMCVYEKEYEAFSYICGIDEAGRGPLAGPVVAGAVVLPKGCRILYVNDSKKLSEKKREMLYDVILNEAVSVGVGIVSPERIDEINIYEATKEAMLLAIKNTNIKMEYILIDAMPLDIDIPHTSIIKGDLKSLTISASSVIAKVTRDKMMYELDKIYPMYDLKNNKGYGTKKHIEAIKKHGITKYHRLSFNPVSDYKDKII